MMARLIGLLALVAVAVACQAAPVPAAREIVIAADMPLTGGDASDGIPVSEAIELAIAQHPQIGAFKLVYLPLDDALAAVVAPVRGVQNVRRMIADNRVVGMVGPFTSTGALEMIPVANAAGLAMVSESVTNWCFTQPHPLCNPQPQALRAAGPNNFFRITAADPLQGRAIARYMARNLKVQRIAAFTLGHVFDDVALRLFTEEFRKDGGDVVFSQNLPKGTPNFAPFLQAARSHGAGAIFAATENDACQARAQMTGIFPQGSYFIGMDEQQESDTCISDAGDNAEGMLATVSVLDMGSSHDPAVMKIAADYRRAYPKSSPINSLAFAGYDSAQILIDAITRAVNASNGSFPRRDQVVYELAHSQLRGAVGTYSFDANGDALSPLMALYQVRGGRWAYLGQIDASA